MRMPCSTAALAAAAAAMLLILIPGRAIASKSQELRGSRPNIVILFVDDFGWGDVGSFWPAFNDTPNIDTKLAKQGTSFSDFHAMSLCAPSRASLMTGRLGKRNGVITNFDPFSLYGLPLNETTLAEYLNSTYYTAMTGKWHLGIQPKYHPLFRGFQEFFGLPMSHDYGCTNHPGPDMECPHYKQDRCLDIGNPGDPSSCHISPDNPWNESIPLYHGYDIIEQPADLWTLCQRYADFGIQFMNQSVAKGDKPFFLYQAFSHMHVPISHHPNFTGLSNSTSNTEHGNVYGDALRELDFHIGRVLDSIDQLGIADNTIVLFTGDNGAPSGECNFAGSNGPFTGMWMRTKGGGGNTGKCSTWEGGHREATIIRWPGKIPAGRVTDALASTLDFVPTLANLAGISLHSDRVYDGIDLGHVLFDGSDQGHETLFHPNSCEGVAGDVETIRVGQFKAKYRTQTGGGCVNWPPGQAGKTHKETYHDPPLIFDLASDQAEAQPLSSSDPNYSDILKSIQQAWAQFNTSIAHDKISTANYAQDKTCTPSHCIKPCCDPSHPLCVCDAQA